MNRRMSNKDALDKNSQAPAGGIILCLQGHNCSMVHRTKLLVACYFLPFKTTNNRVILVGDLDGLLDRYGAFSQ